MSDEKTAGRLWQALARASLLYDNYVRLRSEIPYDSTAEAGPEKYHIPYM